MRISKKLFRVLLSLCVCFLACGSILKPLVSYAAVSDLMIRTGSNAVRTFALPRSSIGTVTNTIDASDVQFYVYYNDASAGVDNVLKYGNISYSGGRFRYSIVLDTDDEIVRYGFQIKSASLPSPGDYTFSFDLSSDFSFDYDHIGLYFVHQNKNASNQTDTINIYPDTFSGDAYLAPMEMRLNSLYRMNLTFYIDSPLGDAVGGDIAFNFTVADIGSDAYVTPGSNTSTEDFQSGLTDSFSDLSSSMDDVSSEIGGVADAIEALAGAMEPHYSNVLQQLHHITEQLHAFYDQVYNNIHLAQMTLLGQIKTAIENIDLEVNVNLDKLKTSIDNMSTAIQNKLQSVQQTLTGGYNTGGIDSDQGKLEDSLIEYEEAEKNVIDKVNDSLNDFEFDSGFEEYTNTISTISDFLQALYDSSGGFKVVINLSLMLSLASLVIGFYRFKG